MGVPLADTVAIGDSDNDLTMIEVAGIGIAMGNGEQCAKDAADWVADAVDTSGLARAFRAAGRGVAAPARARHGFPARSVIHLTVLRWNMIRTPTSEVSPL